MKVCFIINNRGKPQRDKIEFELDVYNIQNLYLIDFLSPYTIPEDVIFVITKNYPLSFVPVTTKYLLEAGMFEDGSLFDKNYRVAENATYITINKENEGELYNLAPSSSPILKVPKVKIKVKSS